LCTCPPPPLEQEDLWWERHLHPPSLRLCSGPFLPGSRPGRLGDWWEGELDAARRSWSFGRLCALPGRWGQLLGHLSRFPFGNYTHVLVYTRSDFGESSIPEAVPIVDVFSRVIDLDFVDKDLDAEQLGGFVRWIAPADVPQVRASGRCKNNTTQLDVVVLLATQKLSLVSQAPKVLTRWLESQQLMRTHTLLKSKPG
ncbi:unnamed protein product, partial [Symbiodinium sp. CCMP2592]